MSELDVRAISLAWYYREQFGFTKAPPLSDPEVVRNMARALVTAAGGDGDLTDTERAWILGYLATKGYPESVLTEVSEFSAAPDDRVVELMQLGILQKSGRILVYDAIRAASADGYSEGERNAVARVAAALGISTADVADIEALVREEHALKARRVRLLMPNGHPNL